MIKHRGNYRSFVDAAGLPYQLTDEVELKGLHMVNVPVGGYLSAVSFSIHEGEIESVDITDCNGSPLATLPGNFLPLLGYKIDFELNEKAYGSLPNLSNSCFYRVALRGKGKVAITYHCRRLPAATDGYGVAQAQIPPGAGTLSMWSYLGHVLLEPDTKSPPCKEYYSLNRCFIDEGKLAYVIHRTGNYVRNLILHFDKKLKGEPELGYDLITYPNPAMELIRFEQLTPQTWHLVGTQQIQHMIPTVVATRLVVRVDKNNKGNTVHTVINDVSPSQPY